MFSQLGVQRELGRDVVEAGYHQERDIMVQAPRGIPVHYEGSVYSEAYASKREIWGFWSAIEVNDAPRLDTNAAFFLAELTTYLALDRPGESVVEDEII